MKLSLTLFALSCGSMLTDATDPYRKAGGIWGPPSVTVNKPGDGATSFSVIFTGGGCISVIKIPKEHHKIANGTRLDWPFVDSDSACLRDISPQDSFSGESREDKLEWGVKVTCSASTIGEAGRYLYSRGSPYYLTDRESICRVLKNVRDQVIGFYRERESSSEVIGLHSEPKSPLKVLTARVAAASAARKKSLRTGGGGVVLK